MNITEIAFIGYPVTDVARAREFYGSVLGLKETIAHEFAEGEWWIEYEVAGHAIALSNAWPPSGASGPTMALEVDDLDAALDHLTRAGHPPVYGPMDTPVCRFFGIQDPDNNSLTIHQRK